MLKTRLYLIALALISLTGFFDYACAADEGMFAGQDLQLIADEMTVYSDQEMATGEQVLFFQDAFSMTIGANNYSSDTALVRIQTIVSEFKGRTNIDYSVKVFLQGSVNVSQARGAKTTGIDEYFVVNGQSLVARFLVTGQIYATASVQNVAPLSQLKEKQIYANASIATKPVIPGPVIAPDAMIPEYRIGIEPSQKLYADGTHHFLTPLTKFADQSPSSASDEYSIAVSTPFQLLTSSRGFCSAFQ